MRLIIALLALFTISFTGCGSSPEPKAPAPKKAAKVELPPPQPKVEVKPDEFASIAACLEDYGKAVDIKSDQEQNRAITRCDMWLKLQGDKVVPELAACTLDSSKPLGLRLSTCRVLGSVGPAATDALIEVVDKGEPLQLQRKAIESLRRIQPSNQRIVNKMIALLETNELELLQESLKTLAVIGEPAKASAKRLSDLRMNHKEESVRVAAGDALKKVDPRHTFND